MSLKQLQKTCKTCTLCNLSKTRTNVVFGKGNTKANILFIGEAPGKNEDEQGVPFVGSAGKKLNTLLNDINLTIDDVYIANILKCRPSKNRNPTLEEIKTCTPYLIKQIQLLKPEIICTLGNYATKFVLANMKPENMKNIEGITKLHGKVKEIQINKDSYKVIPLFHPAATIYNPKLKPLLEKDFKIIKKEIN